MQWWNNFVDWLLSDDGQRIITTAVVPFVAIIVAALIGASIGRGSARRVIAFHDRELKAAAVTALIGVGRKAASWSTLVAEEKQRVEHQSNEAEVRVRLLPLTGASLAADWAAHQLADMKKNSASFSFQAEQTLIEYRDRLIEWQYKPSRAKKLFALDLDRWRYEDTGVDKDLVEKQQQWAQEQLTTEPQPSTVTPAAATAAGAGFAAGSAGFAPETAAPRVPDASTRAFTAPVIVPVPASTSDDLGDSADLGEADETVVDDAPTGPVSTMNSDSADDFDDEPAERSPFSPPVTASTVRERILPDRPTPAP
jgi:hypothetical protein